MKFSVQSDEARRLGVALRLYRQASGRTWEEVLAKKGRDLGIRLYQGFGKHRFGGRRPGRGSRGIAWRELRARTRAGRGTRVRQLTLDPRWAARLPKWQHTRTIRRRRDLRRHGFAGPAARLIPLSRRQKLIAQEVARRQAGIGMLAASFLWFRRRQRPHGVDYVVNRSGKRLGYLEKTSTSWHIVGLVPALETIARRYGIVSQAISEATADIVPYLRRKHQDLLGGAIHAAGLRAR